jgi:thiol-disulfide isomerase/thioredoxin
MNRMNPALLGLALILGGCAGSTPGGADPGGTPFTPPVCSLADLDGTLHAVSAADRPTVLVFWATWCARCRRELPELALAHGRYGDRALFFGVLSGPDRSVDTAKARALARNAGVTYPQLRDVEGTLARQYDIEGTPTIIVSGPDGAIRFRGHRLPEVWEALLAP